MDILVDLVDIKINLEKTAFYYYKYLGTLSHTTWILYLINNIINCLKATEN